MASVVKDQNCVRHMLSTKDNTVLDMGSQRLPFKTENILKKITGKSETSLWSWGFNTCLSLHRMFLDCSDPLLQILQHFPLKQFNVVATVCGKHCAE